MTRFFTLTILLLILSACATSPTETEQVALQNTYTVKTGDTLYRIAQKYQLKVDDLIRINQLTPPYNLRPGQILKLSSTPNCPNCKQVYTGPRTVASPDNAPPVDCPNLTWQWPTQHYSVSTHTSSGRDLGLAIFGQPKQPIYAAATGTVIESHTSKNGYPNLIVIQHNNAFSSLYAYNQKRLVSVGKKVTAGQTIAEMGYNSQQKAMLHFEIRCRNKALNPLDYLP